MYREIVQRFLRSRAWNRAKQSSTWRNLVAYPRFNEMVSRIRGSPRLWLPRDLSLPQFARKLDECGACYVVLRNFAGLPSSEGLKDLDVLIRDADYHKVRRILTSRRSRGCLPVDLHTVSGMPEMRPDGAYLPPVLALRVLNSGIRHMSGFRVPDDEKYFLSLAVHAVYRKGWASGVPSEANDGSNISETKYLTELRRLAEATDTAIVCTLEQLDAHLDAVGWRPPLDQLVLWSRHNEWLEIRLQPQRGIHAEPRQPGLVCLLIRESHSDVANVERVIEMMTQVGFAHISTVGLSDSAIASLLRETRGGNWPVETGGPPRVASAFLWHGDSSDIQLIQLVQSAKDRIRRSLRTGFRSRSLTILHSSDSPLLAAEYIRLSFGVSASTLLAHSPIERTETEPDLT